jgi:cephalosporin hydroxylase
MDLRNRIYKFADKALIKVNLRPRPDDLGSFTFTEAEISKFRSDATPGSVSATFFENKGRPVNKWYHYLDIYERHLSCYQGKPLFFLEIGVCAGGSLDMWRRYFGDKATIVGIDIDKECAKRVDPPNVVRIGSQADPLFLQSVIKEFGNPDVVLDDGSHMASHQRASFDFIFRFVKDGGLYLIEDMHTSYWPYWEGGYKRNGSAIEYVKQMIDDMHAWYHKRSTATSARDQIKAIHVYDSIAVIEKGAKRRPGMLTGGAHHCQFLKAL